MKRDMEYVRELLMKIEASEEPIGSNDLDGDETEASERKLAYHVEMLIEQAGFLTSTVKSKPLGSPTIWGDITLTWQGHEFLEAIRDNEVWSRTKAGAAKVGNFASGFIFDLAKAYGKQFAKEKLGLEW